MGKEIFNISLHLPDTPENQAMWKVVRELSGEETVKFFARKMAEPATDETLEDQKTWTWEI